MKEKLLAEKEKIQCQMRQQIKIFKKYNMNERH